jgi:hypothetical protein
MEVLAAVLGGWAVLSVAGLFGAAAVCRAGHRDDVEDGLEGPALTGLPTGCPSDLPIPRQPSRERLGSRGARQVTHR